MQKGFKFHALQLKPQSSELPRKLHEKQKPINRHMYIYVR